MRLGCSWSPGGDQPEGHVFVAVADVVGIVLIDELLPEVRVGMWPVAAPN
jgi:hypothetical protein